MRRLTALRKVWRFARIYGIGRTWFKLVGRYRKAAALAAWRPTPRRRDIGVIGCGQFAFATIGYVITKHYGYRFGICFDVDPQKSESLSRFLRVPAVARSAQELIDDPATTYIYVASNHASHTDYAIAALAAGKATYIEKPISVTHEQLARLCAQIRRSSAPVYAGYNRPFSPAVAQLRKAAGHLDGPITLNCFIAGHVIEPDHWYRRPAEGTRICGNVGHWLDLAVHLLSWGTLADRWRVTIAYSSQSGRDDDLSLSLTSDRGDLVTIVQTTRAEPFEGINESINYQNGDVSAKIDDFRRMTVWSGERLKRFTFWPKDVGHEHALLQPFAESRRDWREIELSTMLMLFVKDMVLAGTTIAEFSFAQEGAALAEAGLNRFSAEFA
jgi:predicted dehydrogenase